MRTHGGVTRFGPVSFAKRIEKQMDGAERLSDYEHCSYCGSITIDDALKGLSTPGVRYSGCDWKYGWPHKFYLNLPCEPHRHCVSGTSHMGKMSDLKYQTRTTIHTNFYSEHLLDATPEQIKLWNEVAKPHLGIGFEIVNDKLHYSAPYAGYQTGGVVSAP